MPLNPLQHARHQGPNRLGFMRASGFFVLHAFPTNSEAQQDHD